VISDAVTHIQQQLQAESNPETRDWWERYLKGAIGFRGTKMAGIRRVVHTWRADEGSTWTPKQLRDLAIELIRQDLTEDKLAGILLIQEVLIPAGLIPWRTDLKRWARLFDDGFIYDWNTCDWFCVRVLGPLATAQGEECARAIADWSRARNLWRRRAAGVAFVNLAPRGDANFRGFTTMLLDVCERTVRHPERFAQTGTGWVLRELSHAEPRRVAKFVEGNLTGMSREAVRMSVAAMEDADRTRLLIAHGARPSTRRGRR
jgi:3-methyladenine DNA glycosylase AlkD